MHYATILYLSLYKKDNKNQYKLNCTDYILLYCIHFEFMEESIMVIFLY